MLIAESPVHDITDQLFINIICVKRKMYNYLPNDLKEKIVYCREPINNNKCNKCFNCMLYKNII